MEERLPDFPVGILVVSRRVVKRAQKLFAVKITRSHIDELVYERAYRVVIGDGEFV
jgi:hypothetical protein